VATTPRTLIPNPGNQSEGVSVGWQRTVILPRLAAHLKIIGTARIETVKPDWPATGWQWVRFAGNFINLSTPVGLAVARIGSATIRRGPRGLFLGEGYRFRFPSAGAFTIGNVITTSSTWDTMSRRNPYLIQHEEGHTWQYLYCLGLPYYIPYVVFMGWSVLRTGDRAARNFFERQAGLATGGYVDYPVRPIGEGIRAVLGKAEAHSIVRSIPNRFAERLRCLVARSRRSRLTRSGS
jgi:hypothetical protein